MGKIKNTIRYSMTITERNVYLAFADILKASRDVTHSQCLLYSVPSLYMVVSLFLSYGLR